MQNNNKEIINSKKSDKLHKKKTKWYEFELSSNYENIKTQLNVSKQLESLQDSIEKASKNIVSLITIFVVQSMIMPLLFLWFFIFNIKLIFRIEIDTKILYNRVN